MLGNLFAVHPAAIVVADGAPADVRLLKAAEAAGIARTHHRNSRAPSSSTAAPLSRQGARRDHRAPWRLHGRARPGRSDHRRFGRRQERARARADQPRPRPRRRRCRRDLAHRRDHAGVPLPADAEGLPRGARTRRAQHPHDIRRNRGAAEDEPAPGRAARSPGRETASGAPAAARARRISSGSPYARSCIPVAAGRNLAVLLEAAVRNYILQLRGIHSTAEFMERQRAEMEREASTGTDAGR